MFNRRSIITFVFIGVIFHINGQQLQDNLNIWSVKNPIEKVYLHIDRENYYSGEDIWFKAYFMANFLPSHISTSIYAELIDENGNIKKREIFPVFFGAAQGQVGIDTTLTTGNYILRAYSPAMLNQNDFLYTRSIRIFGKTTNAESHGKIRQLQVDFFPEGGNLIEGMLNNVAFKVIDEKGLPADVIITVKNQIEEIVAQTKSLHDGMGVFSILPKKGEQYYAIVGDQRYPFPQPVNKGINLQIKSSAGKIQFFLGQPENSTIFKPAYMLGQMQNNSVFRLDFDKAKIKFSGTIQTASLPSGILQITIFNSDNMPLAERLVFVNNKEYILPAQISIDTLNTQKRGFNQFNIQLRDTIVANISISVTDADFENNETREQNIYSWFLLNSDLKGYVHKPSWYFNHTGDSVDKALDLVMMTNGWRRFKWSDVADNKLPHPAYKDNGFIKLSGMATLEGYKRPLADKELLLVVSPKDVAGPTKKYTEIFSTDSQGNFTIDSLIFFGPSDLFFSDVRGSSSKSIKIKLNESSLPVYNMNSSFHKRSTLEVQNKMPQAYELYLNGIGKVLETATVTGKVKTRIRELDEKYTSGLFRGGIMARSLDLSKDDIPGELNIFEYLQSRVPGIEIFKIDTYHIFYRKSVGQRIYNSQPGEMVPQNLIGAGHNEMNLFLDEIPVNPETLASIPISEFAYLKIFPTFTGAAGGGPGGALVVYTKKGFETNKNPSGAFHIVSYQGYSIIKEFYSPDYSISKIINNEHDNRATLLWQPNTYINDVNAKIPIRFYNNDHTAAYKVVIEGITNDGKLLRIEKIIK